MRQVRPVSVRRAELAELLPHRAAAAREHVSVSETRNTVWFKVLVDGEMVGFGAYIWATETKARVKGIYVLPEHRGEGYGTAMTLQILHQARGAGATETEAIALSPSWYEDRGFCKVGKQQANGAWRVRRNEEL